MSFEREVAILTGLRHPGVVRCFGAALVEGTPPSLVLEFVGGGTLEEALAAQGSLSMELRLSYMAQVGRTLAYLYSRRQPVVHRDVKPANILLERRGGDRVKLTDFGLSRVVQTTLHHNMTMFGTPEYTAPEVYNPPQGGQWTAEKITKVDVYSFCITLHYTLTGRKPFMCMSNAMHIMFAVANNNRPDVQLLPETL